MRDFFIIALEWIIHVLVVFLVLLLVLMSTMVALGVWQMPVALPGGVGRSGIFAALALLVVGGVLITLGAGMIYLGFGIYQNTRRMAVALEHRLMP